MVNNRVVATGRGTSEKEIEKFVREDWDKQTN